jgi:RNA polymerase-binding transcription factor DksA
VSPRQARPDVEVLRERLEAEAARLRNALGRAERVADEARERAGGKAPCAFLDATGDAGVEADPDLRLVEQRTAELTRVEEALARLANDPETFGMCARCAAPISPDRLALLPHATRCRECADES